MLNLAAVAMCNNVANKTTMRLHTQCGIVFDPKPDLNCRVVCAVYPAIYVRGAIAERDLKMIIKMSHSESMQATLTVLHSRRAPLKLHFRSARIRQSVITRQAARATDLIMV